MRIKRSELKRVIREEAYRLEYVEYQENLSKLNKMVNEAILSEMIAGGVVSERRGFSLLREGNSRAISAEIIPILLSEEGRRGVDWGKIGKGAASLAGKVGRGAWNLTKKVAPHAWSATKWTARKAGQGISQGYKGVKALYAKGKQGSSFARMADSNPREFLKLHKSTEERMRAIFGSDIRNPEAAERMLGMLQTDAGVAMLDDLVTKTGMSSTEISHVLESYIHQSEFIQRALAAIERADMEGMASPRPAPGPSMVPDSMPVPV